MYKKRLLERVKELDESNKNALCSEQEQIDSIIKYLHNLLSVRKGSCIINKDFGMDTIFQTSDESFSNFIINAQKELQKEIIQYEPRLKDVYLTFDGKSDNGLYFKFKIEAELANHENVKINLNTLVNFDGNVIINEN